MGNDARSKAIRRVIGRWPQQSRRSAQKLMDAYGLPAECSDFRLVWSNAEEGWRVVFELPRESTVPPVYDAPNPSQAEGDLDVVDEALRRMAG